MACIQ